MFFKDIAGQDSIKQKLIHNIKNSRISHAQLFLGPEGSGKLALAIAYARYISCKNPGPEDACGKCSSCVKFNKFAHPDLNFFFPNPSKRQGDKIYMSKDYIAEWREFLERSNYVSLNSWYSQIAIENKQGIINAADCNEIIRVLGYKSYESEYKIVIIWMIEKLYHAAAPKLLKILEEPPPKTLFLLVSENHDQILPTILSRAQLVKIPRLTDEEVKQGLTRIYQFDEKAAEEAAFLADGNFYQALAICQNDDTRENYARFLRDWLRHSYRFDPKEITKAIENLAKLGRERQKSLLNYGLEIFRQCTLLNYNASTLVKAPADAAEFIEKFSKVLSPQVALQMTEEFSKAIYHIERNANPKILFTDLSLKMNRIFMAAKK